MTSSLSSLPEEVKRPLRPIRTLGQRLRLRWSTAVRAPEGAPTLDLSDGALRRVLVTLGLRDWGTGSGRGTGSFVVDSRVPLGGTGLQIEGWL